MSEAQAQAAIQAEQPQQQIAEENQEVEAAEGGEAEAAAETAEAEKAQELAAKDPAELTKAEKKLIKKYQIKVDGKIEDIELDLDNEEQIKKHLQMSKAAQKRMQEATELRKAAEEFIEMLRKNPRRVLTDPNIGVDLKQFAQEIINEEIEQASKSPEQLEKEKLQRELEELKSKFEKEETQRKEREFQRLQAEQEEKIQNDIESALSTNELPKTPYTVRKMAEMMMLALQNDIDLSPKDLVPLLRKQMNSDIKELFSASSDDVLEELLGKDTISRLRKRTVAKVKQQQVAQTANAVKSTGQAEVKAEKKEDQRIHMKDFLRGKF
jgi:hypothetical protein